MTGRGYVDAVMNGLVFGSRLLDLGLTRRLTWIMVSWEVLMRMKGKASTSSANESTLK